MNESRQKPMMNIDEAAAYCGVSRRTVQRWAACEGLKTFRLGRTVRLRPCDLDEFIEASLVEVAV
jgi:excisionase family DNA binding protein